MKRIPILLMCLAPMVASAAPKPHVLGFGKWTTVQWTAQPDKPLSLKVRALFVDGRLKEYSFGAPHEITDRLFAVRRAFRVNDALPTETSSLPRWEWQPGGWLLVDRMTGHVTAVALPEFDPYYSAASWYRDYIAYCGVTDDGKKLDGVVSQVGRKKAVLKKSLREMSPEAIPGNDCGTPTWDRLPTRVSFHMGQTQTTYAIRGHAVEIVSDVNEESNEEEGVDKPTE
jgi:hypothetical protein